MLPTAFRGTYVLVDDDIEMVYCCYMLLVLRTVFLSDRLHSIHTLKYMHAHDTQRVVLAGSYHGRNMTIVVRTVQQESCYTLCLYNNCR